MTKCPACGNDDPNFWDCVEEDNCGCQTLYCTREADGEVCGKKIAFQSCKPCALSERADYMRDSAREDMVTNRRHDDGLGLQE